MAKEELTPDQVRERLVAHALKEKDSQAYKFANGSLKPSKDLQDAIDEVTEASQRLKVAYQEDLLNEDITKEQYEHFMKFNTYAYHFHDPGDGGPFVEIRVNDSESEPVLTPYSRKPGDIQIPPPPPDTPADEG